MWKFHDIRFMLKKYLGGGERGGLPPPRNGTGNFKHPRSACTQKSFGDLENSILTPHRNIFWRLKFGKKQNFQLWKKNQKVFLRKVSKTPMFWNNGRYLEEGDRQGIHGFTSSHSEKIKCFKESARRALSNLMIVMFVSIMVAFPCHAPSRYLIQMPPRFTYGFMVCGLKIVHDLLIIGVRSF